MSKTYSVTFDVVTPESAAHGDYAETGFEVEDAPIDGDPIETAADLIEDTCGHVEASSSCIDAHTWFTSSDPERDYSDGSETRHSVHLNGFTDDEVRAVAARLKSKGLL